MQLSRYLKVYPCAESPGHVLLFSTRKVSKILVKEETYRTMEKGGGLAPSDEALLLKLGILVHDREEEKRDTLALFDGLNARNSGLNIMVVLNLDCNFSCTYCYEGGMKGKRYMSEETADRLIDFIKNNFPERKKSLLLDFYGGEPLLSIGLIQYISRALQSFTETRGAAYSFTLVTNGSLFTRRIAEELAPYGLAGVKITLDGPAETHNRCRPFKSGAGSFATVIGNIKETCDLVKIGIGGNFARDNHEKFPLLLDYLVEEGLAPDKIATVKFDPVMSHREGNLSPPDCQGGCTSINEPWLSGVSAQLREEILKRGYPTQRLRPITCMIESTAAYVVHFDGVIYKCPGFIGKTGYEAGDLRTGVSGNASAYKPGIWKNEECSGCEYLPLCFGGCRYMTFLRDGKIDAVDCQKAYLDASLETLVKQDVKYRPKAGNR
jgi:uncharacterized protein